LFTLADEAVTSSETARPSAGELEIRPTSRNPEQRHRAVRHGDADPFVIQSSNIEAAASAAVPLAMAVNELCTNAVKYGALSTPSGRIEITAVIDEQQNQFCLRWKEYGGPSVRTPTRQGFGTRLIQQSFVSQLNGAVRLSFDPSGVVWEIDVPLKAISASSTN
jgi:two-component sensor histidine kinase